MRRARTRHSSTITSSAPVKAAVSASTDVKNARRKALPMILSNAQSVKVGIIKLTESASIAYNLMVPALIAQIKSVPNAEMTLICGISEMAYA